MSDESLEELLGQFNLDDTVREGLMKGFSNIRQDDTLDLNKKVLELTEKNSELQRQAGEDKLTGLENYRMYNRKIFELINGYNRVEMEGKTNDMSFMNFSYIHFDIRFLKRINDEIGHEYGNKILKQFADVLKHELKRDTDFVYRKGGDEFVALIPQSSTNQAYKTAKQVVKAARKQIYIDKAGLEFDLSVGISNYKETAHNKGDIAEQAKSAAEVSKRTTLPEIYGKNFVNKQINKYNPIKTIFESFVYGLKSAKQRYYTLKSRA